MFDFNSIPIVFICLFNPVTETTFNLRWMFQSQFGKNCTHCWQTQWKLKFALPDCHSPWLPRISSIRRIVRQSSWKWKPSTENERDDVPD